MLSATDGGAQRTRLDNWKSIARHLGRSCRTVQRWHSQYGLPVRHLGGDTGSVFAYTDELDGWFKERGKVETSTHGRIAKPIPINRPSLKRDAIQIGATLGSIAIPWVGKERSSELVSRANRMWKVLSRSNVHLIARLFRDAIDLDPDNARAYAGLSKTILIQALIGNLHLQSAYVSAKAALEEALDIDPELPAAKCAAAWFDMSFARDWDRARHGFDEILSSGNPDSHSEIGRALLYIAEGAHGEASRLLTNAKMLYSLSTPVLALHCWNRYLAGDSATAIHQVRQARLKGNFGSVFDAVEALACTQLYCSDTHLKLIEGLAADSPENNLLRGVLGYAYAKVGQGERARRIFDAMTHQPVPETNEADYAQALVLIGLNESKKAARCLERSYLDGSLWSLGFRSDPILASLRSDPNYLELMNKVDYPNPGLRNHSAVADCGVTDTRALTGG